MALRFLKPPKTVRLRKPKSRPKPDTLPLKHACQGSQASQAPDLAQLAGQVSRLPCGVPVQTHTQNSDSGRFGSLIVSTSHLLRLFFLTLRPSLFHHKRARRLVAPDRREYLHRAFFQVAVHSFKQPRPRSFSLSLQSSQLKFRNSPATNRLVLDTCFSGTTCNEQTTRDTAF